MDRASKESIVVTIVSVSENVGCRRLKYFKVDTELYLIGSPTVSGGS